MSVLITGSIAYDTVLAFDGAFGDQIPARPLAGFNTTFLTRRMSRTFGGCAANIAAAMKKLGGEPLLWGAVGADGGAYLERFMKLGIAADGIAVLKDAFTAQCTILTDRTGGQIAAFHPGATERTPEVPWPEPSNPALRPKLAVLSPGGRATTLHAAAECVRRGVPYLFDVGQELPLFSRDELESLLSRAFGIAYSASEALAFAEQTGLASPDIARMGKMVLETRGGEGALLWLPGEDEPHLIEPVPVAQVASPVGAGDAMRGGLLFGLEAGFSPLVSARLGAIAAASRIAAPQGEDDALTFERAAQRYAEVWKTPLPAAGAFSLTGLTPLRASGDLRAE